ncbi:hypothetical protein [Amnibacterium kyonggiense]
MIAYLVALGAGLALAITSRVVFWADLSRARRLRADPRIGLIAPALFIYTISAALVLVGFIGVIHEAQAGQHSPVPLDTVWIVLAVCILAMVVLQQRRRRRLRAVRNEARRRVQEAESGKPPTTK